MAQTTWTAVGINLREAPVSETNRAAWYKVIHDILPTHERLNRIRMVPTDMCSKCAKKDTIGHRLTECGEGKHIWDWTKQRLTRMLRTMQERIIDEWIKRPQFTLWPPTRHCAVLWMWAKLVIFRTQQRRELKLHEFIEFMIRTKWKMYRLNKRSQYVGNYLALIDAET